MCVKFQEATPPVCNLFCLIIGLTRPIYWYTGRTNMQCSEILGYNIQVNTGIICLCILKMCVKFHEATPPVCKLFCLIIGLTRPIYWFTGRTNMQCSEFLGYNIQVNTRYTLFMDSTDVCTFSRGHSTFM